MCLTSHLSHNN
uniref:Uncharacterized protein n=1 Tax=Anguilla anguilla TaxID=7936 RepID=A0A0E9TAW3_ANGAN